MIVVIDNYDSFTYNVVQCVGELGYTLSVFRNDRITVEELERKKISKIIISPGPCTPREAGISNDVIRTFSGKVPILGICLGMQCIGYVFGGKIVRAKRIMHGKLSRVIYKENPLFKDVENPFLATRYHSLLIEPSSMPKMLDVIAWTEEKEIMALKHKKDPTWGVQFHPESILTKSGSRMLANFLAG